MNSTQTALRITELASLLPTKNPVQPAAALQTVRLTVLATDGAVN